MSRHILLVCKRLLMLTLVLSLSWFTFYKFFPLVDSALPWGVAIVATYGFLAYIGLPALARVHQALHKPSHVPTRTIAADGWAVDPINVALVARSERDLLRAFQCAGWSQADTMTFASSLRMLYSVVFNKPYPHAPFGSYYVFGRKQDFGFQIPLGNSPRHRHHVRFWRLGTTLLQDDHEHQGFWRKLLKHFIKDERQVWVGSAILDRGLNLRWRNLQVDHSIVSDTTIERQFLVDTLREAGVLKDSVDIKAGEPLHTRHQGFGETIIADGYIKLCEIKQQVLPPVRQSVKKDAA